MQNNGGHIVVVGAGVAGLTLGYLLSRAGKSVLIVEQEPVVGGLARSYHYDDFHFDIGPHRFHTEHPEVLAFIREVLGEDLLTMPRKSGVYMFGKYFDWPLSSSSVFKLPPAIMARAFFDLRSRREVTDPDSFSQYIISQYGRTLYDCFFKFYTEKFIRIPCEEVHVDWALAGINRAVIDKRVKANTLTDLIKGVLLPKQVKTVFLYPHKPGIDDFSNRLAALIRSHGSRILTNTQVRTVTWRGREIEEVVLSDGEIVPTERLIWSGELHSLARMLQVGPFPLRYLAMVCYNVAVRGKLNRDYQWTYYGDRKTTINRTSAPHLFNSRNMPQGWSGLNVEITCFEGDETWTRPESWLPVVRQDLVKSRIINRDEDIGEIWIERVRNTYPIYDLNYKRNLASAMAELGVYNNLLLLGRCGTFWYNNMDHSIRMAMDYADHLISGRELAGKDKYFII